MVMSFILTDTQVSWISISVALLRWTGLITVSPKKKIFLIRAKYPIARSSRIHKKFLYVFDETYG